MEVLEKTVDNAFIIVDNISFEILHDIKNKILAVDLNNLQNRACIVEIDGKLAVSSSSFGGSIREINFESAVKNNEKRLLEELRNA